MHIYSLFSFRASYVSGGTQIMDRLFLHTQESVRYPTQMHSEHYSTQKPHDSSLNITKNFWRQFAQVIARNIPIVCVRVHIYIYIYIYIYHHTHARQARAHTYTYIHAHTWHTWHIQAFAYKWNEYIYIYIYIHIYIYIYPHKNIYKQTPCTYAPIKVYVSWQAHFKLRPGHLNPFP